MFNALWLNAQELNGSGSLNRAVALQASATAGASVDAPILVRRRGLKSSAACGATASVGLYRRKSMRSAVSAGAVADDGNAMAPTRMMRGSGFALTFGLLGASFAREMSAAAHAGATALMYPYSALVDGAAAGGASVVAPVLTRIRHLHGAGSLTASAMPAPAHANRQAFANARAGVIAVGSPDTIIGGIRWAEFGVDVATGADAECVIDPKKYLRGVTTVTTMAFVGPTVNRYVALPPAQALALVSSTFPLLRAIVNCYGFPAQAGAAAVSSLYRTTRMRSVALAGATTLLPRLRAKRYLYGIPAFGTAAVTPARLDHYRGLSGEAVAGAMAFGSMAYGQKIYAVAAVHVDALPPSIKPAQKLAGDTLCGISGTADVDVKLAIKFAAAATAGASAQAPGYFTTRTIGGNGTIETRVDGFAIRIRSLSAAPFVGAQAEAAVWINLYEWEPDFRTLTVDPEDWTDTVDAEDWTLTITDDGQAMKTFTKQPSEILAYDIDFVPWFEQIPRDDIETAACVVTGATSGDPSDLIVRSVVLIGDDTGSGEPGASSHRVKVWIEGGNDGSTYHLTLTIDTEDGRRKEVDFKIKVKET